MKRGSNLLLQSTYTILYLSKCKTCLTQTRIDVTIINVKHVLHFIQLKMKERMIIMRKMDEMEMSISLKSIKLAWFYTVMFTFIWVIFDWIQNRNKGLPFFLLITQNLVLFGTQSFLKWKMSENEK